MTRTRRTKKETRKTKKELAVPQSTLFRSVEETNQMKGGIQVNGVPKAEFIGMKRGENLPKVGYSSGVTLGIGNYQFVKIDIWAELPSSDGDLEATYQKVKSFVQEKLLAEIETIKKQHELSSNSNSNSKE